MIFQRGNAAGDLYPNIILLSFFCRLRHDIISFKRKSSFMRNQQLQLYYWWLIGLDESNERLHPINDPFPSLLLLLQTNTLAKVIALILPHTL